MLDKALMTLQLLVKAGPLLLRSCLVENLSCRQMVAERLKLKTKMKQELRSSKSQKLMCPLFLLSHKILFLVVLENFEANLHSKMSV